MSAKLFIVLNARAGHQTEGDVRSVVEAVLGAAGRPFEIIEVAGAADLAGAAGRAVAAARACGGAVVAAGGDGTINTVAQAVLGSGCDFGVLPQGTFNYFARSHGIPDDTAEAARLLLRAEARPVQVGLLNDRVFLVNASLGLYPLLLEDREAYKAQFGRSRAVAALAGLASLLRAPRQLQLSIGASGGTRQDVRTPTVFVGNNRLQLEQIGVAEAASLADGRLAVIVLKPIGTLAMLWLVVRGAFGTLGDADDAASYATTELTINRRAGFGSRRMKVATDGEVRRETLPLRFRVSAEPLMLLAARPDPLAGNARLAPADAG